MKFNVLKALKIGYQVLQHVEASGVQLPTIKGIPIQVIDNAGKAAAGVIINHIKSQPKPQG